MNNMTQLINNTVEARAKEIVEFVTLEDMSIDWAIEYVKNSTTLSPQSMERVIARAKEMIEAE
jgi:hypothetical protein